MPRTCLLGVEVLGTGRDQAMPVCVQEFEESLAHMTSGNITLVDAHGVSRLAMRKAIRAAFATPEVRKMFEQQNSRALRQRLEQLQREQMLNKIDADTYKYVAVFARVCVCVFVAVSWLWLRVYVVCVCCAVVCACLTASYRAPGTKLWK